MIMIFYSGEIGVSFYLVVVGQGFTFLQNTIAIVYYILSIFKRDRENE
jgi:hypothetical protein